MSEIINYLKKMKQYKNCKCIIEFVLESKEKESILDIFMKRYPTSVFSEGYKQYRLDKENHKSDFLEITFSNSEISCFRREYIDKYAGQGFNICIFRDNLLDINLFPGLLKYDKIVMENRTLIMESELSLEFILSSEQLGKSKNKKDTALDIKHKIRIVFNLSNGINVSNVGSIIDIILMKLNNDAF